MALRGRILVLAALVATFCAPSWVARAADPASAADAERAFVADIAAARAGAGLAPYAVADDLVAVARRQAERMARDDRLYHNPNLATDVHDWQAVGENVGTGASEPDLHEAFMNSASHRAHILSDRYTEIGVGVVAQDGVLWVAEVFRLPLAVAAVAPAATPVGATGGAGAGGEGSSVAAPAAVSTRRVRARRASSSSGRGAASAGRAVPGGVSTALPDLEDVRRGLSIGVRPAAVARASLVVSASPAHRSAHRQVTTPIAVAASMLLLVVLGLAATVLRPFDRPAKAARSRSVRRPVLV